MYRQNIAETSVILLTSGDEGAIGETMNKCLVDAWKVLFLKQSILPFIHPLILQPPKQAYFAAQTMILFSGLKSWTLKQTESWGKSKTYFKGEVYGVKKEEGEGRENISSVLPAPPP